VSDLIIGQWLAPETVSFGGFCSRCKGVSNYLWPSDRTRNEAGRRGEELEALYAALLTRRRRIEQVRARLARLDRRLETMSDSSRAVRLAGRIERARLRLADREAAYARQRQAFLRKKRLFEAILRGEIVVA
jgi:chromosome segregation ATPase